MRRSPGGRARFRLETAAVRRLADRPVPSKRALLFAGGWDGHQPDVFAPLLADALRAHQIETRIERSLECLTALPDLAAFDLIVPYWTMGTLTKEQSTALVEAVRAGANLGGIHGGMGDAFRGNLDYEWMCGGHFASHPHVGDYTVRIRDHSHPITAGLPAEFAYRSEQYYLLIDPAVHVLADTPYTSEGRAVTMPVAWTKHWGRGRVFYCALGHDPVEFTAFPPAFDLIVRGLRWAAGALEA